jgi:hypothetical protein
MKKISLNIFKKVTIKKSMKKTQFLAITYSQIKIFSKCLKQMIV